MVKKKNYTFSDISVQSHKTKKNIIKTYSLSSIKELEIDIFFQQLIARLERNLLNKNLNKVLDNQQEIKKLLKKISLSKKNKVKLVVTIHDLIFLRYPEYFPYVDRKVYKAK